MTYASEQGRASCLGCGKGLLYEAGTEPPDFCRTCSTGRHMCERCRETYPAEDVLHENDEDVCVFCLGHDDRPTAS